MRDTDHVGGCDVDSEIIRTSLAEPSEFEAIFDRHFDSIYGYLARRVGMDVAEDLAADVFLAAFSGRSTFNGDMFESARPWLFGIASRMAARHVRQTSRRTSAYRRAVERADAYLDTDEAEARIEADRARPQLDRALEALRPEFRDVVLLVGVHGLTYAEAAQALGIPIGTVQSRLSRAHQRLRTQIETGRTGTTTRGNGDV